MKIHGHHVSPSEIEALLIGHPAVMEAAVVPVSHKMDVELAMAFIKKTPGLEVSHKIIYIRVNKL
jgi:acyl-coenzyme A synthetase/AMP-(fatty) acid ligase